MNKKPKVFEIIVDYDDETGMMRNSFVDSPAMDVERLAFDEELEDITINRFIGEKSEQKFISVSILADTPIKRINPITKEVFYVIFTKETIRTIVNKFIMEGKSNESTFKHTDDPDHYDLKGVYLVEHFILEKGRVESPLFPDVPDGSWVTTYWVKDESEYDMLLNSEEFNGFSIEINAKIEEVFNSQFSSENLEEELDVNVIEIENILTSKDNDIVKRAKIKNIMDNITE